MPQVSVADLVRLRQTRQWSQIYMAVHEPNTLLTGTVNSPTIARTAMTIPFNNGAAGAGYTAALFDALDEGTTLWIGTNPGDNDVGVVRVRSISRDGWPPVSGTIYVAENDGILWQNDLYLTVLDEHRIWPKLPRVEVDDSTDPATITWWKDYDIAHGWQTHQEPPVVIMGPPACAFIDASTGLATVRFWGNDSYSPRGTALSGAILWTFPHGTPGTANTLGTEAAPHTVTWDTPGVYTIKLSITDANGRTSAGYRTVFIFERSGVNAPYRNFEIRSMRGNFASGGWRATVRVFGDRVYDEECDVEEFPVGAQVVIFADDWYNAEAVSIGGYGHREDIVFAGWMKADSIRKEPITGEVTFDVHSVDGELRNCPAFPQTVERVSGIPANWQEIQDMEMDLVGFYMGYWHSTLYEVVDVLESGDSSAVKYMDVIHTNLYNLLDKGVWDSTVFARALSNRQSRLKYDHNPQYLTMAERASLATIMNLQDEDWLGRVDIQELHENRVSWVDLSGVRVDAANEPAAVFSLAPGDVPLPDGAFKQLTRLVIDDQDDGNILAGLALAHLNNPLPRVRVPLQGNYRIFDLHPQEYVGFPSLETLREGIGPAHNIGTPWPTGTLFIPRNIDIGFRNDFGAFMVTMDMEAETWGPPGIAGYYPEEPPDDEIEPPPPPPPPPEPSEPWTRRVYVSTNSNGVYYTSNFSGPGGGDPTWITVNAGLGSLATRKLIGDPFNPSVRQYVRTTEPKIYRRTGGAWGVILDQAIIESMIGTIVPGTLVIVGPTANMNSQGHVYAAIGCILQATGWKYLYFFKSVDYGENWTATLAFGPSSTFSPDPEQILVGALQGASSTPAGQVIYITYRCDIFGTRCITVSNDQGASWAGASVPSCSDQWRQVSRSPADHDILYFVGRNTPGNYTLCKHTAQGAGGAGTWQTLWACAAPPPRISQRPGVYIWDPDSAFMAAGDDGLHWTEDDWASYVTHANADAFGVDGCSRVMDYPENLYGWQSGNPAVAEMQHVIAVSHDRGDNWEGKAGANPDTAPYIGSIPNNAGGIYGILQVWTD